MKSGSRRMINVLFKPIMRSISKRNFGKLYHKKGLNALMNIGKYVDYKYVIKDNRVSIVLE